VRHRATTGAAAGFGDADPDADPEVLGADGAVAAPTEAVLRRVSGDPLLLHEETVARTRTMPAMASRRPALEKFCTFRVFGISHLEQGVRDRVLGYASRDLDEGAS
jgi:hypothetical protein